MISGDLILDYSFLHHAIDLHRSRDAGTSSPSPFPVLRVSYSSFFLLTSLLPLPPPFLSILAAVLLLKQPTGEQQAQDKVRMAKLKAGEHTFDYIGLDAKKERVSFILLFDSSFHTLFWFLYPA